MNNSILSEFGFDKTAAEITILNQGLINHTWKITIGEDAYILQKINDQVFKNPGDIDSNISYVSLYLKENIQGYRFVAPLISKAGATLVYYKGEGYYRAFPFVKGSFSKQVAETPLQAYEASKQFGRFTKNLVGIDISKLKITIPHFHDLSLRYKQFLLAIEHGNADRILKASTLIKEMKTWSFIVEDFQRLKLDPSFKSRVTHHDTKVSNVLFDKNDKGICVIDLDTVMPGYFISDVGDMMRTYLCPVSEEEIDFSKIEVRSDFYEAIVQGYFEEMKDELTTTEKKYFFYAGAFMIYMQAIRFLTDYLNNDVYYGARYTDHNFNRATNQGELLKCLYEKQSLFEDMVIAEGVQ